MLLTKFCKISSKITCQLSPVQKVHHPQAAEDSSAASHNYFNETDL